MLADITAVKTEQGYKTKAKVVVWDLKVAYY